MKKSFVLPLVAFGCLGSIGVHASIVLNLQPNLVGQWSFSGNSDDASSAGNHAIIEGAQLTTDRFGNANSALIVTAPGRWKAGGAYTTGTIGITGNSSRTISYWTKFSALGTGSGGGSGTYTQSAVYWGNESAEGTMSMISVESTGGVWFNGLWVELDIRQTTPAPAYDEWRMITFAHSDDFRNAAIYVNSVLQAPTIIGSNYLNTMQTILRMDGGQGDFIDDVYIYNKALSSEEVTALYQAQSVAVPEPSTFLTGMLLVGAASLWALKRRKR